MQILIMKEIGWCPMTASFIEALARKDLNWLVTDPCLYNEIISKACFQEGVIAPRDYGLAG